MRHPLLLVTGLMLPLAASAQVFFTSFEDQDQRTAGTFTVEDGSLSATFSGGTAFTIGNQTLYRTGDVSWMLDPEGSNSRGTSTGEGNVELSEPAERVLGYVRTENAQAVARMQVIDSTGAVVREVTATDGDWSAVAHEVMDGEALITRLRFINDGGGMAALDDFEFATDAGASGPDTEPEPGDDGYSEPGQGGGSGGGGGGGGSGAPGALLLSVLVALCRRRCRA